MPSVPTITIHVPNTGRPTTPTMTPNPTPLAQSPQSPQSKRNSQGRVSTPTSGTAPLTSWSTTNPKSCYLCDEQNPGDFSPTTKFLEACLLCSRDFCPIHREATAVEGLNLCNINHSQHYHEQLEAARKQLVAQSPNVPSPAGADFPLYDESQAEEMLMSQGVFPSLGERDRMLWKTSPVTDARMREIENFRSLDAEISGTKGQRRSTLIETKSIVGADIAV